MAMSLDRSIRITALTLGSVAWFSLPLTAQSAGALQFVPQAQLSEPGMVAFGRNVSLSSDDLLVRAGSDSFGGPPPYGQFVYHRRGGVWSQQAAFDLPSGHPAFGRVCPTRVTDLSIVGDVLVIGQPGFHGSGGAWISQRSGSAWSAPYFIDNSFNAACHGQAVLVVGGLAFIGAPEEGFPGLFTIWRQAGAEWNYQIGYGSTTVQGRESFGTTLAVSGTTLLVGASRVAHVLERGATALDWSFQAELVPPDGGHLRAAVIDGDVVAISTSSDCQGPAGIYVYERSGTTWAQTATLVAADVAAPVLGKSLLLKGDTIYAGAPGADSSLGAVYVFQRQGSGWAQTAKLSPDPALPAGARFGSSLAGDGLTLCVGAPGSGSDQGTVQVFDIVPLPPPQTYCTAKVNSQGCLPAMGSSGIASATNPNPFLLTATNVLNNKTGLVLYSVAGAANVPFQGGTRCFALPFRRTPAQNSGGNPPPNDCSGTYSFDFNARIQSGIDGTLVPGRQVWCQFYSRDPASSFGVGLTDAVTFVIGS